MDRHVNAPEHDLGTPEQSERPRLGAIVAIGSIITAAFMGSVVVTPLYLLYQRKFGFSEITLTLIYATYVIGNVVALLLFGQISDLVGRKRVTFPALGLAAISALIFLFAQGTVWLFLARLSIGLSVGILSGTGTAWLAERFGAQRRRTATTAAATANLTGIAVGPLLGGLLAQYAPAPLRLPFIVYLAILVVVAVSVARVADPHVRRVDRLRDARVRPRVGVPADRLGLFTAPAITAFVMFALGGLYFALAPTIVRDDLNQSNVAVGGAIVFEYGAFAALMIVAGRKIPPPVAMTVGLVGLLPSLALIVTAQAVGSMPLLLVATAFAGLDIALGYRGSLEVVNGIAPDDRRAEVVSTYYIACFVGNSLPVIGIGILSTVTDAFVASVAFAVTLAVLTLIALVWFRRNHADDDAG